jgi:hypothetical protein
LKDSKGPSPFDLTVSRLEGLDIAPIPRAAECAARICDPDRASEAMATRPYLFHMDAMMFSRSNQGNIRLSYRVAVNFGTKNWMILF